MLIGKNYKGNNMLIKNNAKGWGGSINFIDVNDNFVGFDMSGQCCETFGWYITREVTSFEDDYTELQEDDLEDYRFDTSFVDNFSLDETVIFRLVNDVGSVAYLHLYNSHNGYYSHGWESEFNGVTRGGSL